VARLWRHISLYADSRFARLGAEKEEVGPERHQRIFLARSTSCWLCSYSTFAAFGVGSFNRGCGGWELGRREL